VAAANLNPLPASEAPSEMASTPTPASRGIGDGGSLSDPAKLQAALAETAMVIHTPPDIPGDAEILGVCAISKILSSPGKYGWVAKDLVAWKDFFHKVVARKDQVSTKVSCAYCRPRYTDWMGSTTSPLSICVSFSWSTCIPAPVIL